MAWHMSAYVLRLPMLQQFFQKRCLILLHSPLAPRCNVVSFYNTGKHSINAKKGLIHAEDLLLFRKKMDIELFWEGRLGNE